MRVSGRASFSARAEAASSRLLASMLSVCLLVSDRGLQVPAAVAGPPPFSAEQKLAAEAWKVTDREFVDRSFGGQDWFKTRQALIKATKATSRDETYDQIRAMLASLDDKYTRFLTPAMYGAVYAVATGDVAGVGVELSAEPMADASKGTEVTISNVFEGSPAERAGLKVGDVLTAVDGEVLPASLSAEETSAKVRGPAGSRVGLKLRRAAGEEVVVIERGLVKIDAVTSKTVGDVGLIRIRNFSTSTAEDVRKALESFRAGKGVRRIVIDLRANTGGFFPGGVDVARLLLPEGVDITTVTDYKGNSLGYSTFAEGLDTSTPLYVLVDAKTASASEILASALQDNARAQLVGTKTFGKAVIQNVATLSDGSAVVVTTARYQTPKRTDINKRGIQPDLARDCAPGTPALDCLGRID